MRSANFAPVHSEFVSKLVRNIGLGDEGNLLSKVEVNFLLGIDTLNFDQTDAVVLVSETALVSEDGAIDVKLWWSRGHDDNNILKSVAIRREEMCENENHY